MNVSQSEIFLVIENKTLIDCYEKKDLTDNSFQETTYRNPMLSIFEEINYIFHGSNNKLKGESDI